MRKFSRVLLILVAVGVFVRLPLQKTAVRTHPIILRRSPALATGCVIPSRSGRWSGIFSALAFIR